ncbi:DUF4328 domain-containing protein [Kitasatospora sp. MMS16-BH015]|uniref:DUF4328 domain-containing protein n=1 Tax=Kitasatospora sp. MMS16-BH015 TaxID=2018025 RepID=UPI000CF211F4|nr:DUF4328 domain-containing protein [Kitasatospora sp. MMS16-BH015]
MRTQGPKSPDSTDRPGGERPRPVSGWATATTVLICLAVVRELLVLAANWREYQLVHDYLNGSATEADVAATEADTLTAAAGSSGLLLLVAVPTAVAFLVWLWRARANAELIGGRETQRRSRLWVVGSWIAPVINLWYPYQVVVDIWRARVPRRQVSLALVNGWWACFVLGGFVKPIQWRVADSEQSEQDVLTNANLSTLLTALILLSGVLLILIMRRVTATQNQALELGRHTR